MYTDMMMHVYSVAPVHFYFLCFFVTTMLAL